MTKVERRLVVDGDFYEVSCAVREDGVTSPASNLLDELEEGMWADPEADVLPDEYQPKLRRRVIAHLEQLAAEGDLPGNAYNRLNDGIWEIKVEGIRISFFDTDGEGHWSAKCGSTVDTWDGGRKHELPDDFDEYIRLGHTFPKAGQKTLQTDINECIQIRKEDVSHDERSRSQDDTVRA